MRKEDFWNDISVEIIAWVTIIVKLWANSRLSRLKINFNSSECEFNRVYKLGSCGNLLKLQIFFK